MGLGVQDQRLAQLMEELTRLRNFEFESYRKDQLIEQLQRQVADVQVTQREREGEVGERRREIEKGRGGMGERRRERGDGRKSYRKDQLIEQLQRQVADVQVIHTEIEGGGREERDREREGGLLLLLFVGCLTSQQHASVSQGRICTDNFMCCHTEIEAADPTFHLTQSQYTDTGSTSPSADPITPGAWQGSHWSANVSVTGMTRP